MDQQVAEIEHASHPVLVRRPTQEWGQLKMIRLGTLIAAVLMDLEVSGAFAAVDEEEAFYFVEVASFAVAVALVKMAL